MSTRGRPREFDRDEALRTAMKLFWRHGYEATSVADLGEAMGITSPSLYAAFGSKENLYRESLELYVNTFSAPAMRVLDETADAREAIERFLRTLARQFVKGFEGQHGCMIASGDLACGPEHVRLAKQMGARRARAEDAIRARLEGAVRDKQQIPTADTKGLAAYFASIVQGMSVQARDGASLAKLNGIVSHAMSAWPADVARARAKRRGSSRRPVSRSTGTRR